MKLSGQLSAILVTSYLLINCLIGAKSSTNDAKSVASENGETHHVNHKQTIKELRDQIAKHQKEIDDLKRNQEAIAADARELEDDIKTWRAKFEECSSEETLLRQSEAYLRQEKDNFALEVSAVRQEADRNEHNLKSCKNDVISLQRKRDEKTNESNQCNCQQPEMEKSEQSDVVRKKSELMERMANCEATEKVLGQRCAKEHDELVQMNEQYKKASENSESCLAHLTQCQDEKLELELEKKDYEVKVYSLEQKAKDAKEAKERSDKLKAEASEGASRYYKYLIAIILLFSSGGTVKIFAVFGKRLRERAESKQTVVVEGDSSARKKLKKKQ